VTLGIRSRTNFRLHQRLEIAYEGHTWEVDAALRTRTMDARIGVGGIKRQLDQWRMRQYYSVTTSAPAIVDLA